MSLKAKNMTPESHEDKFKRLVAEEEASAAAEAQARRQTTEEKEYIAIKLQHDEETESGRITEVTNEYAKDGWTLHLTQFLPTVEPTASGVGSGDLVLFFQRVKQG